MRYKRGLLIEGSVTNILTANQSSFEISSVAQTAKRCIHEQSAEWSKHGNYSQKVIRDEDEAADAHMWYRCSIAEQGFDTETPFIAQVVLYLPMDNWYIGRDITFRMRFAGGNAESSALTTKTFTLTQGENLLWAVDKSDFADRQWVEYFIWETGLGHRAPAGTVYYTDCHMVEVDTETETE